MRALGEKLRKTVRYTTGICLLWGIWLTQAFAVIAVEPAVTAPDENSVVRFSVTVSGVPEPGFRSYALSMQFGGAAVNLVNSINSFTTPPPADAVSCAAQLRLDAESETVLPGLGVILESGQGAFVLDSIGGGSLLFTDNSIVNATTTQYNFGVAGVTEVITPQIGAGSLIDFLCYVGADVPDGTTVTVTPGLYPGLDGVISLDEEGSLPIDNTFIPGAIQVGPVIDPQPVANDDTTSTLEDTPVSIDVLANDSDPNGDSLTIISVVQPANGTVVNNGTNLLYTPNANFHGVDSFSYTIDDGNGNTATATVTVTVDPVNDAPVLTPIGDQTIDEGVLLSLVLSASDVDGDALSFSAVGLPTGATLTDNGDGTVSVSWTPDFTQAGSYPVTFTVTDNGVPEANATESILITVVDVPQLPVAVDDAINTPEDTPVSIDVLANDSDPNGDSLTIISVVQPANGTVVNNGTNLLYTPNANFHGVDSFSYTIDDGNGNTATATVTVTVEPVNDAPVLDPIGNQSVNEGDLLSLVLIASDLDADGLSFTVTGLPTGAAFTDNTDGTASFSWTPGFDQAGSYDVTITVTDDNLTPLFDSETITITVVDVNQAPVLDPIDNQTVNEGDPLSLVITASDADGNNLSFTATGLPVGATFVDNADGTASFAWTPGFEQEGSYDVTVTVTDDNLSPLSDNETITITVVDVNQAPVLDPIGNQTVNEGDLLSLALNASDLDADGLSFTATGLPVGATFVDNLDGTASFAWTPGFDQAGSYDVTITVTDDNLTPLTDSETITITVVDVNQSPILDPIGNQSINEGELLSLVITASDLDADGLSFTAIGLPVGATLVDNLNGTASFAWTPGFDQAGSYDVTITVTDDNLTPLSDSETITITVVDVNQSPVLDPIGSQTVAEGDLLSLLITASDPDGDGLSFTASNLPTGATFVDNGDDTALFEWIPDFGQSGNFQVLFTATDDGSPVATDWEEITITVGDVNQPPELDPIVNQLVDEGQLLSFLVTANDPDDNAITLTASNLPTGAVFTDNGGGSGSFEWTPDFGQAGNYDVTFTALDNGVPVESDTQTMTITVGDVNQTPILNPIGNRNVDEGALLSFVVTSSDPDDNNLVIDTTVLPPGATFVDNLDGTGVFEWTPDFGQSGNYDVTFTVTDDGLPIETDSELIIISVGDVNLPPELDLIDNKLVNEGELLSFVITASDVDGDNLSFTATGLPMGATFVDNIDGTASFAWTPDFGEAGNYEVTFTVADDGSPSATDFEAITISVGDVNRPPELDPIGDRSTNEGDLLSFVITANDLDGDNLSFSGIGVPASATFIDNNDGTASFSWTPDFGEAGNYEVTFTVTDDNLEPLTDSETITITVGDVNQLPVLDLIGNQMVNEGELLSFVVTASDMDGNNLSITTTALPLSATFVDNGDGTGSFNWMPDFDQAGTYTVTFTVTDDGVPTENDAETIEITVSDVNQTPVLDPIGELTIYEGVEQCILITASDLDGDNLTFTATGLPIEATFVDNGDGTATFCWAPSLDQAGSYPVSFTVSDDGIPVLSDSETITITVVDVNQAPTLDPIGDKTVNEGGLLSFLITASDSDGNNLSFIATGLPVGATFVDNLNGTADFSWTPDYNQAGNYLVSFTVSDNGVPVLTDSETITITVIDVILQQPPVANDDVASTLEDTAVTIDVLANDTDPNGDILTIMSVIQPANGTVVNNVTSLLYTPNPNYYGVDTFSYTISDGNGGTDSATVTVTVDPVDDPLVFDPIPDQTVYEGELLSFVITASDPDGDPIILSASNPPSGATFTDNGDGTANFAWTPDYGQVGNYYVTFGATSNGITDLQTMTITVLEMNQLPVLDPIGNQTVNEGELLSLVITASDIDGDNLGFTATGLPLGATFIDNGDATATFSWTPDFDQADSYVVSFTVTDDGVPAESDAETITITVVDANEPPVLDPIGNQAVNEDQLLTFGVTTSDPNGDAVILTAANLPTGATFTDNGDGTGTFSWTPSFLQAGNYSVLFTVTDDGLPAMSDSEEITITVGDVNRPPELDPIGPQTVAEGELLSLLVTASDPEGDGLTFSTTGLPLGATFVDNGDGTALFEWTPDLGQAGNYDVGFTVTDDGVPAESDAETITITVGEGNQPPVLDPIGNRSVNEGELLEILLTSSDPEGDGLTLTVSNLPSGALFTDNGDGTALFEWTPDFGQASNYEVSFIVTDNGVPAASDSETITITVGDVNRPPELDPIGNRDVEEGELLEIMLTASDPDGDLLTFSVANLPTGALFNDNGDGTASFSWTPDFGQTGSYEVSFTVNDDGSPIESDGETITINVGDVNRPPVLDPVGDRSVNEDELLEITLTASDLDGDTLSFTIANLPTGALFTDNLDGTATFSWIPDFGQAGNYEVSFTVTDDGSPIEKDAETITITVGDVNRPPTLDPIGDRGVLEGELLEIILTATDPDGDNLSYDVSNLPPGALFTDNLDGTATFTWSPDFGQAGNYEVSFTVTDDGDLPESDAETITITVGDVNRPPTLDPIGDQTVTEGQLLEFVLTASDPDGDYLTYSVTNLPAGASLIDYGDGTALFSWVPDFNQAGIYDVTFTVTDDGIPAESDSAAISITVGGDTYLVLDPIGNQTVNVGELLDLLLTASDAEGDNLVFYVTGLPEGATFVDNGDGTANLSWVPTADQVGNHEVTVTVTDDGIPNTSDSETFIITVLGIEENLPPVLAPIGEQEVVEGELLNLVISASDPNGDNLSFTAVNLPIGASLEDNGDGTASFSWTPTTEQVGEYEVIFTVTDDGLPALTDSEVVEIEVELAGSVPEAPEDLEVLRIWRFVLMAWDSSEGAMHYQVYRKLSYEKDFTVVAEPTVTFFTDYIPRRARSVEYYVVAVNEYGVSEPSDTLEIVLRSSRR